MAPHRALSARVIGLLVIGATAASLVSCTDDNGRSATPPTDGPSGSATSNRDDGDSGGPLRLAVFGEPETVRAYREIAEVFEEETGHRVAVTAYGDRREAIARLDEVLTRPPATASPSAAPTPTKPSETESGAGSSSAATQSGSGAPDVFLVDSVHLPDLLTTQRLHPVDEDLEERGLQFGDGYQRLALTAFSAEDGLQCMPVDVSPHVLFVNTEDVRPRDLEIRGVPLPDEGRWDFEDFAAAARIIAREHEDEPGFRAVHLPDDIRILTAFIRSAGGEMVDDVDEPAALTLDSDEAREAITAYVRLTRQKRVALTTTDAQGEAEALQRFARGELAMRFGTRADVPRLRESEVPFDVRPLPSFGSAHTVADLTGLCVDEQSEQLEAALDLVAFAAGNDGSAILARSGATLPANLDVAFSPVFAQQGQPPKSEDVFLGSLRRSGLMPFSPAWPDVAERVEKFVGALVEQRRPLEPTLDRRLPQLDKRSTRWFEATPEGESTGDP